MKRLSLEKSLSFLVCLFPWTIATGKSLPDIIVSITAIGFLALCIKEKKWTWIKHPFFQVLLLLWVYMVGRSLFLESGPVLKRALLISLPWGRYVIFAAFLSCVALPQEILRKRILFGITCTTLLLIADGLFQSMTGYDFIGHRSWPERLTGPFHYPRLGYTLSWIGFPSLIWLSQKLSIRTLLICFILFFLTVFLSGDRTAILLCIAGAMALNFYKGHTPKKTLVFISLLTAFLVFLIAHIPFSSIWNTVYPEKSVVSNASTTSITHAFKTHPKTHRVLYYMPQEVFNPTNTGYTGVFVKSLHLFKKNPLFGVGPGSYRLIDIPGFDTQHHSHHFWLEFLYSIGIVGTIILMYAAFLLIKPIMRRNNPIRHDPLGFTFYLSVFLMVCPLVGTFSPLSNTFAPPFWFNVSWAFYFLYRHTFSKEGKRLRSHKKI